MPKEPTEATGKTPQTVSDTKPSANIMGGDNEPSTEHITKEAEPSNEAPHFEGNQQTAQEKDAYGLREFGRDVLKAVAGISASVICLLLAALVLRLFPGTRNIGKYIIAKSGIANVESDAPMHSVDVKGQIDYGNLKESFSITSITVERESEVAPLLPREVITTASNAVINISWKPSRYKAKSMNGVEAVLSASVHLRMAPRFKHQPPGGGEIPKDFSAYIDFKNRTARIPWRTPDVPGEYFIIASVDSHDGWTGAWASVLITVVETANFGSHPFSRSTPVPSLVSGSATSTPTEPSE